MSESLQSEIIRIENEADCLYTFDQVQDAIRQVALQISPVLSDQCPLVCGVMNGAIPFMGMLLPCLPFVLEIDYFHVSRYDGELQGGDQIHWRAVPQHSLADRVVLVVDDILDQGKTLEVIKKYCEEQGAKAVYTAVLVKKRLQHAVACHADFVAIEAEDRYLFGCGMDYKGYLRNAPGIFAVKA